LAASIVQQPLASAKQSSLEIQISSIYSFPFAPSNKNAMLDYHTAIFLSTKKLAFFSSAFFKQKSSLKPY
jgi:hypothetical protein